jgi:hypothetical protein
MRARRLLLSRKGSWWRLAAIYFALASAVSVVSIASFGIAGFVAVFWLDAGTRPLSSPNLDSEPAAESRPAEGVSRPAPQTPEAGPKKRWT